MNVTNRNFKTLEDALGIGVAGPSYVSIEDTGARYFIDSPAMIAFSPAHPNVHLNAGADSLILQAANDAEALARTNADANMSTTADNNQLRTDLEALIQATDDGYKAADLLQTSAAQALIDAEAAARQQADTDEITTRTAAVNTLTAADATEANARATADAVMQGNIDAEATTRAAADTALSDAAGALVLRVNTLEARIAALEAKSHDPVTLTTFAGASPTLTAQEVNIPPTSPTTTTTTTTTAPFTSATKPTQTQLGQFWIVDDRVYVAVDVATNEWSQI